MKISYALSILCFHRPNKKTNHRKIRLVQLSNKRPKSWRIQWLCEVQQKYKDGTEHNEATAGITCPHCE